MLKYKATSLPPCGIAQISTMIAYMQEKESIIKLLDGLFSTPSVLINAEAVEFFNRVDSACSFAFALVFTIIIITIINRK